MLPGTSLGHYRIVGPLGRGGMGEVFAAEDTRLKRRVALKLLPSTLAADPERRRRLEREAQAIAALNHPNIVTVYSVEEVGGTLFLSMEAVEGQTLRDLAASGPLPIDRLLTICIAIADALAAAHQRGITHRDLKPANVMVTHEGRVKVLDFGLARLDPIERAARSDDSTTFLSDGITGAGRIAGTVAYMSPEQAEGRAVDQRSDVFSFGIMLHELATGERPFKGDSELSVLSAILKDTPSSITEINPKLPEGLARIVRKCLAKDPSRRYQSTLDIRNDLEELGLEAVDRRQRVAGQRRRNQVLLGAVGLIAVSLIGIGLWSFASWGARRPLQVERVRQLTAGGITRRAAISPDGRYVVHVNVESGQSSLWVRQTVTESNVRIVEPTRSSYGGVTFSADGNFVYYVSYPPDGSIGTIYRVATLGGVPVAVVEDIETAPTFSPEGSKLAFIRGYPNGVNALMTATVNGDGVAELSAPSGAERFSRGGAPAWSPDGRTILVLAEEQESAKVMEVDVASGEAKEHSRWILVDSVHWLPDSHSYVVSGVADLAVTKPQLWHVPYPSGDRRRLTTDLSAYGGVSISRDGKQMMAVQAKTQSAIWVGDFKGQPPAPLSIGHMESPGEYGLEWLSESRLLFTSDPGGALNLWSVGLDGAAPKQLTHGESLGQSPFFSPADQGIYFTAVSDKGLSIARIDADGRNQRFITKGNAFIPVVSRAGDWVYYSTQTNGITVPMKIRPDGTDRTQVSTHEFQANDISPDGTLLVGMARKVATNRFECGILPVTGGSVRFLGISAAANGARILSCKWHPLKAAVTFLAWREERLAAFAKALDGSAEERLLEFPSGPRSTFYTAWAPGGKLAVARGAILSDVVLISLR